MAIRAARRRRRGIRQLTLAERLQRFLRSWAAVISVSVLLIVAVLAAGITRFTLPFDFLKPPPAPDPWGTVTIPSGATAKLAYIGNTQSASIDAPGTRQAIELALKERGTVKDTNVELTVVEDACNPAQASARAEELVQDTHLVGVITNACPASVTAAKSVFESSHVPYLTLGAGGPNLTAAGTSLNTFRLTWNQTAQAKDAARYARRDLRVDRALSLHDGTPEHEALAGEMGTQYRSQRGTVLDVRPVGSSAADAGRAAQQARDMNTSLIYYSGAGVNAVALLNALKQNGYSGTFMVSDSVHQDPAYLAAGPLLEGTFASTLEPERSDRFTSWKEGFEKEYGTTGTLSPEAYDAASLLLQSIDFTGVSRNGRLEVGRQRLANIVRAFPYQGVTGTLGFDANGDRTQGQRPIVKYENGQWTQAQASTAVQGEVPLPPEPGMENAFPEETEEAPGARVIPLP